MCMLHYVYSEDASFAKRFIVTVSNISANGGNKDGFGVYTRETGLYKTKNGANILLGGYGVLSADNLNEIMAHTRAASPGMAVTDELAHPFEVKDSGRFIGAHNGRLYDKNEYVTQYNYGVHQTSDNEKESSGGSDSKKFFEHLESVHNGKPLPECLNVAMEEFRGKFAFLIFDKEENVFYAARGTTAKLYSSNVTLDKKRIGYVITTGEDALISALVILENIYGIEGRILTFTSPALMKEETIFRLGKAVKEVGSIKEKSPQTYTSVYTRVYTNAPTVINGVAASEEEKNIGRIISFMTDHFLSAVDIDLLFFASFGHGILAATTEEVDEFVKSIIPVICAGRKIRDTIKRKGLLPVFGDIYKKTKLVFPWMINPPDKIVSELEKLKKGEKV